MDNFRELLGLEDPFEVGYALEEEFGMSVIVSLPQTSSPRLTWC
jgi:hypothetical protein